MSPQMGVKPSAEPGQLQEAMSFIPVSQAGAGARGLGTSAAAFPGSLAGSWIRSRTGTPGGC